MWRVPAWRQRDLNLSGDNQGHAGLADRLVDVGRLGAVVLRLALDENRSVLEADRDDVGKSLVIAPVRKLTPCHAAAAEQDWRALSSHGSHLFAMRREMRVRSKVRAPSDAVAACLLRQARLMRLTISVEMTVCRFGSRAQAVISVILDRDWVEDDPGDDDDPS